MDTPLMNEIERIVFFGNASLSSPYGATSQNSNRYSEPAHQPRQSRRTTVSRLKMLTNLLSPSNSVSDGLIAESAGSSAPGLHPQPSPIDASTFSIIAVPDSPHADDELNGVPRVTISDGPSGKVVPTAPPTSAPKRLFSRIFGGLTPSSLREARSKGRRYFYFEGDFPLDGEEGELVDEGCFVDIPETEGFDILSILPAELALLVLCHLDLPSIVACLSVSRNWRSLAVDSQVWRELFFSQRGWKINYEAAREAQTKVSATPTLSHRLSRTFSFPSFSTPSSRRQSSISTQAAASVTTNRPVDDSISAALDWPKLYKSRRELERRWTDPNYKPQATSLVGHVDSVYCVEFDSKANVVITGSRDRTIKIWSLSTGELQQTLRDHHAGSVLCLKFSAADGFMVSGSSDRTIIVWEMVGLGTNKASGTVAKVLHGHAGGVLDLRIDSNWIVSCSKDAVLRVWSRHTLEPHCDLSGHEGPVNAVGLQGDRVVSASGDGKMILWDLHTRSVVRTYQAHDRGLACVEFQGDLIISGSNDRKIKVWSVTTGECLQTLSGHDLLVRALSFDSRSGRLVSASYDKSVKVWDLDITENQSDGKTVSAKLVREFKDFHSSQIFDVKFDVGRIVSSSHDEKVVILDFGGDDLETSMFI